jgi:putative intracellular protease/amidase
VGKRILMVVTSHRELPSKQATGYWLEELAAAYYPFDNAGYAIDLASPQGGLAPCDPLSLQPPWISESGSRFVEDSNAQFHIHNTIPLHSIEPSDFDALYCVGGLGAAWDFVNNPPLDRLIENMASTGRVVASICHGVLGLTGATNNGRPFVSGLKITGISNAEETMTGFDTVVPVLPESRLRELGGEYSAAEPFASHVVSDGRVITGQNPASAAPLAAAIVHALRQ